MQYKIPQNVRREDKIVGPLTLKQLVILGIGGGISYALYVFLAREYIMAVWLPASLIPALITIAFAFIKINGIPFHKWILLLAEYMLKPRKRTFTLGAADLYQATIFKKSTSATKVEQKVTAQTKEEKMKNIGEITKLLDTYGKPPKTI